MSKQANLLWNFSTVNNFLHLQFIFLYLLFQYSILEDLLKTFLFLISSLETSQPTCSTIFNFYLKIKHLYCHMPRSNSKTELKCRSDPDTSPLPSYWLLRGLALEWFIRIENGLSYVRCPLLSTSHGLYFSLPWEKWKYFVFATFTAITPTCRDRAVLLTIRSVSTVTCGHDMQALSLLSK